VASFGGDPEHLMISSTASGVPMDRTVGFHVRALPLRDLGGDILRWYVPAGWTRKTGGAPKWRCAIRRQSSLT